MKDHVGLFGLDGRCRICGDAKASHQGSKRSVRSASSTQCACGFPKSPLSDACTNCIIERKRLMRMED